MGLLDDAIREHLDLKRRRGADPAEVERAEQEALGPVRRGPIEAEPPELVLDEAPQPGWDVENEHESDAPITASSGLASDAPDDDDDPFGDEGPVAGAPPPPMLTGQRYGESELEHERLEQSFNEDFEEPSPPPHRAPLPHDQLGETIEYDVDDAPGDDAPGDDAPGEGAPGEGAGEPVRRAEQKPGKGTEDDPLEETPEFLQETPDHDRLWFEQRPPRDFDFDG